LRALKPDRLYEVENVDLSTRQVYRGAELAEAFPISITAAPGSVLVIYRLRK